MKRFAFLCALAAIGFAEDTDGTDGGSDTWEDIKNWASAKQEQVEFMTIVAPSPCLLKGAYGWYRKIGTDNSFIRQTVHGCDITDASKVLTWAVIENPDEPGMQEAYYCTVDYKTA